MQKVRFSLVLFLFLLIRAGIATAQWEQTKGPYGGGISCLAANGSTLYAGGSGGNFFVSSDNGAGWTTYCLGNEIWDVTGIATIGTNVFVGTQGAGVFRSTDNGVRWAAVNNGLTFTTIDAFAGSPDALYAGTYIGLFRSGDNGAHWNAVGDGKQCSALAVKGRKVFEGTYGQGIYVSTDDGASWYGGPGFHNSFIEALLVCPPDSLGVERVYAGTFGSGVYVSTNDGKGWTAYMRKDGVTLGPFSTRAEALTAEVAYINRQLMEH